MIISTISSYGRYRTYARGIIGCMIAMFLINYGNDYLDNNKYKDVPEMDLDNNGIYRKNTTKTIGYVLIIGGYILATICIVNMYVVYTSTLAATGKGINNVFDNLTRIL